MTNPVHFRNQMDQNLLAMRKVKEAENQKAFVGHVLGTLLSPMLEGGAFEDNDAQTFISLWFDGITEQAAFIQDFGLGDELDMKKGLSMTPNMTPKAKTPFQEIFTLFSTYKKVLVEQNKALKQFDMDKYSRLHPERLHIFKDYDQVVTMLIDADLKQLKLSKDERLALMKLVKEIKIEIDAQCKNLTSAMKTQERLTEIYKKNVTRQSLDRYAATGHHTQKRQTRLALSEVS